MHLGLFGWLAKLDGKRIRKNETTLTFFLLQQSCLPAFWVPTGTIYLTLGLYAGWANEEAVLAGRVFAALQDLITSFLQSYFSRKYGMEL